VYVTQVGSSCENTQIYRHISVYLHIRRCLKSQVRERKINIENDSRLSREKNCK